MVEFARFLSNLTGVPVSDQTGRSGVFDISLRVSGNDGMNGGSKELSRPEQDPGTPSIFTALREQLGLKLVPAKGDAESLVIDSVKRPSDN
jgi:uncharacterized protein (TIGR03435 family)